MMPAYRWDNFAQDILYQEPDPRLAAFRYRCLPQSTSTPEPGKIATSMLISRRFFFKAMVADRAG